MRLRLPAHPAVALGLVGLAAVLAESVGAWGPATVAPAPRMALFLVAGCLIAAVALASDPAWSFSGAIAASMFSGRWADIGLPLPLDRLLIALGIVGLLLRMPIARVRVRLTFVQVALGAAALFAVVSAYISGSLTDKHGLFALLDRYGLVPFVAFLAAPYVFDTARRRAILLGVLVACGAYLGVTALAEVTRAHALVWPSYILDSSVGIHVGRARGPFVEAGAMGLALWGCGVAAVMQAAAPRRPWMRPAGFVVGALCVLGVLFTLTRAIWLGAAISAALTLVFARELRRFIVPALLCAVLLVVGALAVVPGLASEVNTREQTHSSVWDRLNSNSAALRMMEARPLTGFGWNSFEAKSLPYYQMAFGYPLTSVGQVHSVFLSNAAELGVIGTFLWLVALVAAVGGALARPPPPELRPWRIGLLAIAVMWFVTANFAPLANVFPNLLLWTWAGVLWARQEA